MDIGQNMATCQNLNIKASKDASWSVERITMNIQSDVGTPFNKSVSYLMLVISTMCSEFKRLREMDCEKPTGELLVDSNLFSDSVNAAYQEMTKARDMASQWCERISEKLVDNATSMSEAEENLRAAQAKVSTAEIELKQLSDEVTQEEDRVRRVQNELAKAERDLINSKSDLYEKEKDRAIVTGVGAGLMAIPVVGWIAGGTMLVVSATALTSAVQCAETAVKETKKMVEYEEKRLNETRQCKQEADNRLAKHRIIFQELKTKVELLKQEKDKLIRCQQQVTELNEAIKKCTCTLGTIWASTKVLHNESSNLYSLESLVYPLKDITRQMKGKAMANIMDSENSRKFDELEQNMLPLLAIK